MFGYLELTGKQIFNMLLEEFIITDIDGNIIMLLEDLTEDLFFNDYVEEYIQEYTDDFYDTFRYKAMGNTIGSRFLTYGLFITSEIIEQGRIRRINNIIE